MPFPGAQGSLVQARFALKPDGLFLGAMLGGQTLQVSPDGTHCLLGKRPQSGEAGSCHDQAHRLTPTSTCFHHICSTLSQLQALHCLILHIVGILAFFWPRGRFQLGSYGCQFFNSTAFHPTQQPSLSCSHPPLLTPTLQSCNRGNVIFTQDGPLPHY